MERRTFIQTLIFSSGLILINPRNLSGTILDKDTFKIFMLYNNSGENPNLKSAWGLSIWIEGNDTATLFDTGGDSSILWDNILHANLDIAKLSKIVISHNHWDHKNGLELILEKTFNKPEIYVVEKDYKEYVSKFQNAKIKSISNAEKIDTNIWTTGPLKAIYSGSELYEQSLILTQDNSICYLQDVLILELWIW